MAVAAHVSAFAPWARSSHLSIPDAAFITMTEMVQNAGRMAQSMTTRLKELCNSPTIFVLAGWLRPIRGKRRKIISWE
jgi:hypothetical protein